ncbi:hypothetical protein ACFQVD_36335 [Streptosporangium amethystogenes subsp. fukuiense]|uniref:Uncharacterized protein n=1 Tax=Streptosporangium amethystogenes subsp. fukuiense TaxID=698418 RepID=A0ABW2TAD8_9ACTN
MITTSANAPSMYVAVRGACDGLAAPALTIRPTASGRHFTDVPAPGGEQWTGSFAVGDGVVAATTHVPGDPDFVPRLYKFPLTSEVDAESQIHRVPLPSMRSSLIYVRAVSRDGALAVLVVDTDQSGREECFAVPLTGHGPVRILPAPEIMSHVFDVSVGPKSEVVLAVAGAPGAPQHRRILHHDLGGTASTSPGTVLIEDGDHGIYQIYAVDLSPDGTLLAVAGTRDGGGTFAVLVMPVGGGTPRELYQRPVSWADPVEVDLSFDGTGEHLLVGHGDICWLDISNGTCRVLTRCDEEHWMRVAW